MTIHLSSLYASSTVTDTAENGGVIDKNNKLNGLDAENNPVFLNALFPKFTGSETENGATRYRKAFYAADNNNVSEIAECFLFMTDMPHTACDVFIYPATQTDTQINFDQSKKYGIGLLDSAVNAGDKQILSVSKQEHSIYRAGDTVAIIDAESKATLQYLELETVTYNGDIATLNTVEQINKNIAAGAYIASCIYVENVSLSYTSNAENFATVTLYASTTETDVYTLTRNDGSVSVTSQLRGDLGSHSLLSEANIQHENNTLFTLNNIVMDDGDTVTLQTTALLFPYWQSITIAADSPTIKAVDNYTSVVLAYES